LENFIKIVLQTYESTVEFTKDVSFITVVAVTGFFFFYFGVDFSVLPVTMQVNNLH